MESRAAASSAAMTGVLGAVAAAGEQQSPGGGPAVAQPSDACFVCAAAQVAKNQQGVAMVEECACAYSLKMRGGAERPGTRAPGHIMLLKECHTRAQSGDSANCAVNSSRRYDVWAGLELRHASMRCSAAAASLMSCIALTCCARYVLTGGRRRS